MYYRDINQMNGKIDWVYGTPKNHSTTGLVEYTKTRFLYDTTTKPSSMKLRRPYTRQLHDSATVISIPQELYGETISKKSIRLTDDSTNSTIILQTCFKM